MYKLLECIGYYFLRSQMTSIRKVVIFGGRGVGEISTRLSFVNVSPPILSLHGDVCDVCLAGGVGRGFVPVPAIPLPVAAVGGAIVVGGGRSWLQHV